MSRLSFPIVSILLGFFPSNGSAEPARIDYARQIKPILAKHCYACHGGLRQKAGLRLDTAALIRKGGKGGEVVEPGSGDDSLLLERVTAADSTRMPPEGEGELLTADESSLIKRWIDQGADGPADETPEPDSQQHWSFRPPVKSGIPGTSAKWVRNPVDAFIAAEHETRGLAAEPEADRAVLLRRVYLDLTGVPPTRPEVAAFQADPAADAYEKVVDRLLSSPGYAARWARHWMDLWRYSDWYGRRDAGQHRNSRMHIWRWRDWIIEAVAADKPYDRMILEMIAGDELEPSNPSVQRATGYLGRSYYVYNRNVWLQETLEFVSSSFLGLTMKCARCHDHKYDPIAQDDYYRLRAVFEPHDVRVDRLPGKPETQTMSNPAGTAQIQVLKDGLDHIYDRDLDTPTYVFMKGDEKAPVKTRPIPPGVPAKLSKTPLQVQPVDLPVTSFYPDLAPALVAEQRGQRIKAVADALDPLQNAASTARPLAEKRYAARLAALNSFEARLAADRALFVDADRPAAEREALARIAGAAERSARVADAEEGMLAAEAAQTEAQSKHEHNPKDKAAEAALGAADQAFAKARSSLTEAKKGLEDHSPKYTRIGEVYPRKSSGRRLALARWIASRDNPLTARVLVNHVWMRHFGAPLVPTVANFGTSGKPPTHPKLLDWLAVEFMERGWSIRDLHRLLVTSGAYRMRSSPSGLDDPNLKLDRDNVDLWRMNPRRMEAEAVRDSMLQIAGRLDRSTGGSDLDPSLADKTPRRSIYFRHTPDDRPDLLVVFDAANPLECFRREESILPQQALAMANGQLARETARVVTQNLEQTAPAPGTIADDAFIALAFRQILGREPSAPERTRSLSFLRDQALLLAESKKLTWSVPGAAANPPPAKNARTRARENLVHVLLNHNDFITIR